ncbi:hypothetical protein [Sphingobacterium suaedae]|uniref:Uncharacterized protein n=1 Tax=Sphingobacterium suaedae TaxID=1686402 RepID=A0ABW5KGX6_9SPHI
MLRFKMEGAAFGQEGAFALLANPTRIAQGRAVEMGMAHQQHVEGVDMLHKR